MSIWLALRQMVWLTPDGELREDVGSDQPDMVRWADTSCMVVDCVTKRMRSDRLSECLRPCWHDLIPTDESVFCKMKKQKGRRSPDGSAGGMDRNDHFGQWRVHTKEPFAVLKSLRSDTLTTRVTGVKITVFSSDIVIDVIVQCHTAGALWVKVQKSVVPNIVWLGFDPFRPISKSHTFCPLVLEACGRGWSQALREVVAWIVSESRTARCLSTDLPRDTSLRIAQHISCTPNRENARAILRRSPRSVNLSSGLVGDQVSPSGW